MELTKREREILVSFILNKVEELNLLPFSADYQEFKTEIEEIKKKLLNDNKMIIRVDIITEGDNNE